jgi:signal transduction histidine kinase
MIAVSLIFMVQLFFFKYSIASLKVTAHVFVFICWLTVIVLVIGSGGFHSYVLPWLSLIPIVGLVLLGARGAWWWSGVGFLSILCFLAFDVNLLPADFIVKNNEVWIASLHIGLLFIILILTYIFDRQQNDLIQKIEHQNESLKASQEEILQQRDTVEMQNSQLHEARNLIEQHHASLQVKNDELEIEISRRTKDLLEYTQQLEQFAFITSHNLRSPIARIMGLGNLLAISNNSNDAKLIQEKLISSAHELDQVVKDLNMLLEVRKGSTATYTELDARSEIELVLKNLEKDIVETGGTIHVQVNSIGSIYTIRPYFISIVMNLVSNAIKYRNPTQPLEIHIEGRIENEKAFFAVRDNGVGIDLKSYGNKLFHLYSRFHTHVDGKGLGLYLVKTQIEMLGGKIEVSSEVNKGTEFRFWIKAR